MTDLNKLLEPLFLREESIRRVIELMFFSYREFTAGPDKILNSINLDDDKISKLFKKLNEK